MKKIRNLTLASLGLMLSNHGMADGLSIHAGFGVANAHFTGKTQDIYVVPGTIENQYTVPSNAYLDPFVGAGVAYQWDAQPVAINLGLSLYNIQSLAEGVNTPSVNVAPHDPLEYYAEGSSTVLMFEPKFILTTSASWQPYILTGMGASLNHFSGYVEVPTGSTSVTTPAFAPKSKLEFAYEFGIGIQHPLADSPHAPILALDYRYMNLGNAALGDVSGVANTGFNLGKLSTRVVALSVIWPL